MAIVGKAYGPWSLAETGPEGFNIDTVNDPVEAKRTVNNRVALWGGVNNPKTIFDGTPEDVKRDVFQALDAG